MAVFPDEHQYEARRKGFRCTVRNPLRAPTGSLCAGSSILRASSLSKKASIVRPPGREARVSCADVPPCPNHVKVLPLPCRGSSA
ncbi:hypothetical protein K438DRAFT_611492 [Mycena galopus ATCC 62051]|nr:hypothetical protein K438DRAFT_611492 [Mycena galopus ATCC 62051]